MELNRISAEITAEDMTLIRTGISDITTKLPFLVDLSPDDKQSMLKFGDKSVAFVNKAAELVQQNQEFLPRSFSVEEFLKDVKLYSDLYSIIQPLRMLHEKLEDTFQLTGSEAYAAALVVYRFAKLSSGELSGLESILDDLGKRFIQKTTDTEPEG